MMRKMVGSGRPRVMDEYPISRMGGECSCGISELCFGGKEEKERVDGEEEDEEEEEGNK